VCGGGGVRGEGSEWVGEHTAGARGSVSDLLAWVDENEEFGGRELPEHVRKGMADGDTSLKTLEHTYCTELRMVRGWCSEGRD
jgi:hypothetical protein